jgi:hypothetical protein
MMFLRRLEKQARLWDFGSSGGIQARPSGTAATQQGHDEISIAIEERLQGAVLISPNAVSSHQRAGREHPAACFAQDIFGRA